MIQIPFRSRVVDT